MTGWNATLKKLPKLAITVMFLSNVYILTLTIKNLPNISQRQSTILQNWIKDLDTDETSYLPASHLPHKRIAKVLSVERYDK